MSIFRLTTTFTLLLSIALLQKLSAQTFPADGDSLNYRLIGFAVPKEQKDCTYKLEIARGNCTTEQEFDKHIIQSTESRQNKIIAEVPEFGSSYTWRAVCSYPHAATKKTALLHFSTKTVPNVDTAKYRLVIIDTALKYKDDYVFTDDSRVLYDMNGRPVWFMPDIQGHAVTPRDIKLSPQGTITFLFDRPYEINYNGDVLWTIAANGVVSKDAEEHFHHEITRLSDGHYMALGQDSALWQESYVSSKENLHGTSLNDKEHSTPAKKVQFGTLIEYDEKGNVVWSWSSSGYFLNSDLKYYVPHKEENGLDVHENSFYFDEKNKVIYVSYKNISRILKVKYPEGTVEKAYGEIYKPGEPEKGNGLYCGQHAINISQNGYVYLYNNNSCNATGMPQVLMMQEPRSGGNELKKIWEYDCTMDDFGKRGKTASDFISGGNVSELPDHSVFVCMSGSYSKLLIINPEKKILWSGFPEYWNSFEKKWTPVSEYRASIISRDDVARLIWNSESKSQSAPQLVNGSK